MKIRKIYTILFSILLIVLISCSKEDYIIEYQDGYPNKLAGNWVAFEFRGGNLENSTSSEPYDMVTAIDPNRDSALIIDRLYDSDIRVRTSFSDSAFHVNMGEMMESVSTNTYGIEYITVDGYITENPVLINALYSLAQSYYANMDFDPSFIEDLLFMRAGFYDEYKARVDTVLILGYRKTGFEEIDY